MEGHSHATEISWCPGNVAGVVHSHLSNKKQVFFLGGGLIHHKVEKGCSQGHAQGFYCGSFIANIILKDTNFARYRLQAFVDDFSFIFFSLTRSALEKEAAMAFSMFNNLLQFFHLQISSEKSQASTFVQPHDLKNCPSTIRLNGVTILQTTSNKILRVKIDKHLSQFPHFNYLKDKLEE